MDIQALREKLLAPSVIENMIYEVVKRYLIPRFLQLGMRASGEWENSLEVRGNELWGRKYTEQLEYGRRPGTFAPIAPIIEWVKIKLGIGGAQGVSIAWAINHKMKNEGTKYYREGGTDLMDVLYEPEVIDFCNEYIGAFMKAEVQIYVSKEINEEFKKLRI